MKKYDYRTDDYTVDGTDQLALINALTGESMSIPRHVAYKIIGTYTKMGLPGAWDVIKAQRDAGPAAAAKIHDDDAGLWRALKRAPESRDTSIGIGYKSLREMVKAGLDACDEGRVAKLLWHKIGQEFIARFPVGDTRQYTHKLYVWGGKGSWVVELEDEAGRRRVGWAPRLPRVFEI